MKNSILIALAFLVAASNLSAVRRQDIVTAAQEMAAKQAQAAEAQKTARETRNEYGNNASEQNKAKSTPAQTVPKAPKNKKPAQSKQEDTTQQAPENDASQPKQEDTPKTESPAPAQNAAVDKEPVVQAQSSYAARFLKLGAAVGTASVVTLAACKAYMVLNPVVYPVLLHNTVAGASWCFANCL